MPAGVDSGPQVVGRHGFEMSAAQVIFTGPDHFDRPLQHFGQPGGVNHEIHTGDGAPSKPAAQQGTVEFDVMSTGISRIRATASTVLAGAWVPAQTSAFFPGVRDRYHRVQRFHLGVVDVIRPVLCRSIPALYFPPGRTISPRVSQGKPDRDKSSAAARCCCRASSLSKSLHAFHFMPGDFQPVTGFQCRNRVAGGNDGDGFGPSVARRSHR